MFLLRLPDVSQAALPTAVPGSQAVGQDSLLGRGEEANSPAASRCTRVRTRARSRLPPAGRQ